MFVRIFLSCMFFAAFIGCNNSIDPCEIQIGSHSAVTPTYKKNRAWWMDQHNKVLEKLKQKNVNFIFIGDSIMARWEIVAMNLWNQYYASRGGVNMGIGGNKTEHVLWRLENGGLANINPKFAVVLVGVNNTESTAVEIADGVTAITCLLRTKLPQTKILLLHIFPNAFKNQGLKTQEASEIYSKIADKDMIHYLNISDIFLDANGNIKRELLPDLVHPNLKGYEEWAKAMEPTILELL